MTGESRQVRDLAPIRPGDVAMGLCRSPCLRRSSKNSVRRVGWRGDGERSGLPRPGSTRNRRGNGYAWRCRRSRSSWKRRCAGHRAVGRGRPDAPTMRSSKVNWFRTDRRSDVREYRQRKRQQAGQGRRRGTAPGGAPRAGLSGEGAQDVSVGLRAMRARVHPREPERAHRPSSRPRPRQQPAGRQQLGAPVRVLPRQRARPLRRPRPGGWLRARADPG